MFFNILPIKPNGQKFSAENAQNRWSVTDITGIGVSG